MSLRISLRVKFFLLNFFIPVSTLLLPRECLLSNLNSTFTLVFLHSYFKSPFSPEAFHSFFHVRFFLCNFFILLSNSLLSCKILQFSFFAQSFFFTPTSTPLLSLEFLDSYFNSTSYSGISSLLFHIHVFKAI